MLYYISQYLDRFFDIPGARLMTYISFRSGMALILSLFIATVIGRRIIDRLQLMQVGEIVRNLGLEGQMKKAGTPTMGGIIIIISTLIPCLLIGRLDNIYMILMIIATVWLGSLGFADDYIKVAHHDKEGLKGKFKIVGQVGLGLIVGITMYLSPNVVMRENVEVPTSDAGVVEVTHKTEDIKSPQTTIPFVKNNNFDYTSLTKWMGKHAATGGWILFIIVTIFVVTAVSNGANLTDGLDGLATGIYAGYLNIMYIPGSEELVVYAAAFIGALIGFLWYNSFPAQVFMGDTGSLTIGGIIAVFAILIRKELLIPILCAIFFIEDLSVIIQVAYFKYTKKKYGAGRRVFKMTPLHHHFQKPAGEVDALIQFPHTAIPESKIVMRFFIVAIFLAVITFVTLKIR